MVLVGVPHPALLGHLLSFAAGVMLYISYGDMVGDAAGVIGSYQAGAWMFVGMLFFRGLVVLLPEPDLAHLATETPEPGAGKGRRRDGGAGASGGPVGDEERARRRLWMTGLIAALGVTMHNFPEGLVVYTQTVGGICHGTGSWWAEGVTGVLRRCASRGLAVTLAIALHNIPEGMAVAAPIMTATGSSWQALKWCLLSSVAEPAGAVVFGVLLNQWLTREVAAIINCVVAGIMIMLCLVELVPTAAAQTSPKDAALTNVIGQIVMFVSIQFMVYQGVH